MPGLVYCDFKEILPQPGFLQDAESEVILSPLTTMLNRTILGKQCVLNAFKVSESEF